MRKVTEFAGLRVASDSSQVASLKWPRSTRSLAEVSALLDPSDYLTDSSDIVALLIFEHQMALQNSLTRVAVACRRMLGFSLKNIKWDRHIFAHRCSYLIYSDFFRKLTPQLKLRIFERLSDVLCGKHPGNRYAYLQSEEGHRIFDILQGTHPELKTLWEE